MILNVRVYGELIVSLHWLFKPRDHYTILPATGKRGQLGEGFLHIQRLNDRLNSYDPDESRNDPVVCATAAQTILPQGNSRGGRVVLPLYSDPQVTSSDKPKTSVITVNY